AAATVDAGCAARAVAAAAVDAGRAAFAVDGRAAAAVDAGRAAGARVAAAAIVDARFATASTGAGDVAPIGAVRRAAHAVDHRIVATVVDARRASSVAAPIV